MASLSTVRCSLATNKYVVLFRTIPITYVDSPQSASSVFIPCLGEAFFVLATKQRLLEIHHSPFEMPQPRPFSPRKARSRLHIPGVYILVGLSIAHVPPDSRCCVLWKRSTILTPVRPSPSCGLGHVARFRWNYTRNMFADIRQQYCASARWVRSGKCDAVRRPDPRRHHRRKSSP